MAGYGLGDGATRPRAVSGPQRRDCVRWNNAETPEKAVRKLIEYVGRAEPRIQELTQPVEVGKALPPSVTLG